MGDRKDFLEKARKEVEKKAGKIVRSSSLYETAAWGMQDQDPFLNQALLVNTKLSVYDLLTSVLQIEEDLGRKREVKYGPRTIDIDIILYNNDIIDHPELKVPHPEMQNRRFVLEPLNEIAGNRMHPVFHKSIAQLLAECPDPLTVNKFC
jgi:2-amino-4-hydroxy-6-hydroxymethyldihydropteridine diphosphokinase